MNKTAVLHETEDDHGKPCVFLDFENGEQAGPFYGGEESRWMAETGVKLADDSKALANALKASIRVVSNDQYHADHSRISHSMIEQFRRSPQVYRDLYVTRTMRRDHPSPAMRLGSAVHCNVLEPHLYGSCVAVFRDGKTLESKAGAKFIADNPGKILLTEDQESFVSPMAESILSHPAVNKALASKDCVRENSVYWADDETGQRFRCKPDILLPDHALVFDIKTAANVSEHSFVSQAASLGYHRQADWYCRGASALYDRELFRFVHVVVGSNPPHECHCYFLDDSALSLADEQNTKTIRDIHDCHVSGRWSAPSQRAIVTTKLPKWAHYQE